MNTNQKSPTHSIFTVVHIAGVLVTLIPVAFGSKANYLGYKSLCSFTPISTIVFLALAGLHIFLLKSSTAQ